MEAMIFRKFGTALVLLSLSPLVPNNDKCPALKTGDRCFCKQRLAGLKSGLQVP